MSDATASWRGYYLYAPGGRRHAMRLELAFRAGRVSGGGSDDVGAFTIRGGYDEEGVRVWWTKHYVGAHAVDYEGVRDGAGSRVVYGAWRIAPISGGFRIWRGGTHEDASIDDAGAETELELAGAASAPHDRERRIR